MKSFIIPALIAGVVMFVILIAIVAIVGVVLFIFRDAIGRAIAYGVGFSVAVLIDLLFLLPFMWIFHIIYIPLRIILCVIAIFVYKSFFPEILIGSNKLIADLTVLMVMKPKPEDDKKKKS